MTLAVGTKLGPYEILGPLGKGGMGEVYKARDTRLERTVAIKVLPQHMSTSPEVRQRFEREAKTISQLSHPHICALYDVGNQDGTEYLVMELLDGETLSDRLGKGSLPLSQTLRYGVEIADALDKAHRQGIVHRDLKPGNVMLTKSGVKLLDFGLAKAMAPAAPPSGATSLTTVMGKGGENLTEEGTILGTFQYMSPEQLEGKDADGRTDIFAFGCVLYEMATGRKAFSGSSQASLISSIMKEEPPPVSAVLPTSPPALDRVIRKALAKDPEDRWQSAGDLGSELKWIAEGGSASGIAAPTLPARSRRAAWMPWAAAVLVAAAAGLGAGRLLHRAPAPAVIRASVDLPPRLDLEPQNTSIALSPDGETLAMAGTGPDGKRQLWVRRLDGFGIQPLAGTEDAMIPFWSPDSRFIGFFADHKLKKIPAAGGTAQTICDADDGRGASWSAKDVIVFAPAPFGGLSRVSAAGGAPTALTKAAGPGLSHRLPHFLPDGRHLLYLSGSQGSDADKTTVIHALDIETGQSTLVAKEASEGRYAAGHLLFVRERNLMAQPFDASSLKLSGEAVPIAEGVQFVAPRWCANFGVSQNGRLVFEPGGAGRQRQLTWFDLDGKELSQVGVPAIIAGFSLSPDGTRAVASQSPAQGGAQELWLYELSRGVASRFSFSKKGTLAPRWSPDGRQVAFGELGGGVSVKPADGTAEPKKVWASDATGWPLSWSPDGKFLICRIQDPKTGGLDLWIFPMDGGDKARPLIATPAEEFGASISPDGKWLLYTSNESGRGEMYVVPFPALGEKRQVSTGGVLGGSWLSNNSIVFTQPPDQKLFAVDLEVRGSSLLVGPARPLFGGKSAPRGPVEVAPDGKRVLIAAPLEEGGATELRLVSDWTAGLAKR